MPPRHEGSSSDVPLVAAEIYAASIVLKKFLHLAYIMDELEYSFVMPIPLEVDHVTAILFRQGTARCLKL